VPRPGQTTVKPSAAAPACPPAGTGDPRHATLIRSYLADLVGLERSAERSELAIDELAAIGRPAAADVHRVARRAGLDVLDAEVGSVGWRLGGIARGSAKCPGTTRRLRARADGVISTGELHEFYRHVAKCPRCAAVAGRFEAAEWQLQVELAAGRPPRIEAPPPDDGIVSAARITPSGRLPASPAWKPRRWLQALVVAAVGIVVGGLVVFTGKPPPGSSGSSSVAQPGAVSTATALTAEPGGGVPFVIGGMRFAVFTHAKQRWTAFAASTPAGGGKRWLLVTVRARNLTRPGFDPTALAYRVLGADGASYTPDPAYGTGSAVRPRPAVATGRGALVQAELAFRVPSLASGLRLAFYPAGASDEVVAGLGT
jgi:hypothetical protein